MKILVTGGNGFIGRHLIDRLEKSNHDVASYDITKAFKNTVNRIEADILDSKELDKATKDIDVVYHLAAVSDVNNAFKDPTTCVKINNIGTLNVLEAARKNNVKRVIFASTVWVYSTSKETRVDENSSINIASSNHIYTSTKIAGELFCHNYNKLYGQDFTILRYGIPYGPGAREALAIPLFIKKALNKEGITIFGDGSQYRNFLWIEDLAEGNILALKDIAKNQTYNLAGEKPIKIHEVASIIKTILGDVEIRHEESRKADFKGKTVSSEKAKSDLGWEAKTSFTEGISKYIEWYKKGEIKHDICCHPSL